MSALEERAKNAGLRGRDPFDPRDYPFSFSPIAREAPLAPPPSITHEAHLPPIKDQGQIGSCTAQAAGGMREFLTLKVGHTLQPLSELWLYFETRRKFWDINEDSGAYLREVMAIIKGRGIALEQDWPYDTSKWNVQPPSAAYGPALSYRNVNYYRLQTLREMIDCLAAGWVFVFGFPVHPNFEDAEETGIVPLPNSSLVLGWHAVLAYGYRTDPAAAGGGWLDARNSWGNVFGRDGNLHFPWEFIRTRAAMGDVWTLHLRSEDL